MRPRGFEKQSFQHHGYWASAFYRKPVDWRKRDAAVIDALNEQIAKSPQAEFWKRYKRTRQAGYVFNHKRVYRVHCLMGLNKPRRAKLVLHKRITKACRSIAKSEPSVGFGFYAR